MSGPSIHPEGDPPVSQTAILEAEAFASEGMEVRPEQEPPATAKAQKEAAAIAGGKLKRDENIRWHLHYGGVIMFWAFLAAGLALLFTWVYHIVAPQERHFLTAQQRFELQTLVLAALGSSFVTAMARRWSKTLSDDEDRPA
jgi:hypothetical protein